MESEVPNYQITALTKISTSQLYQIRQSAVKQGYNPQVSKLLLDFYIANKPKCGGPSVYRKKGARIACPAGEVVIFLISIKEMYVRVPENCLSVTVVEYNSRFPDHKRSEVVGKSKCLVQPSVSPRMPHNAKSPQKRVELALLQRYFI